MKFIEFLNTFKAFPVFSVRDIEKAFPHFDRKVLVYWQKKGYILKIRNSWYCFVDRNLAENDLFFVANKIYAPSYVSLESALSFYRFIPEGVFSITSVSTVKSNSFDTPVGNFLYRNIKLHLNFGYVLLKHQNIWFKMAEPEKAILDYLYLNPGLRTEEDMESIRLNPFEFEEGINVLKLENYANYINSKALKSRLQKLIHLMYA